MNAISLSYSTCLVHKVSDLGNFDFQDTKAYGAKNFKLKNLHFLPYLAYSKTLFISEKKCCLFIFIHRSIQSKE